MNAMLPPPTRFESPMPIGYCGWSSMGLILSETGCHVDPKSLVNGFRFKDGELQDQLIHSNNYLWKSDPGFANYKAKDFSIRPNAEVLERIPGLDRIPFKKIGLR